VLSKFPLQLPENLAIQPENSILLLFMIPIQTYGEVKNRKKKLIEESIDAAVLQKEWRIPEEKCKQ
jgi:hypothetical protein